MLPLLSALTPDAAILILTLGIALIAVELNRPGSILPGAAGLLLSLLAVATLASHHAKPIPALAMAASVGVLLLGARYPIRWWILFGCIGLLGFSMQELLPAFPGPRVSRWAAALSAIIIGTGTTVLTRIARRARQNKGLD